MRKLTLKEDSINRDLNVFLEILETPAAFEDEVEKSSCQALLEELNEDEVTEAANTSYAYWYVSSMENEKMPPAGRVNAAMKKFAAPTRSVRKSHVHSVCYFGLFQ